MVQTDRHTSLSPLDYHYNVVEFSRNLHLAYLATVTAGITAYDSDRQSVSARR